MKVEDLKVVKRIRKNDLKIPLRLLRRSFGRKSDEIAHTTQTLQDPLNMLQGWYFSLQFAGEEDNHLGEFFMQKSP